jgi:formate dehydrogenase subunit beta
MVRTQGDALTAMRNLLAKIWQQVDLDGMLVPAHGESEIGSEPLFLKDPSLLAGADPCVPLVPVNAAKLVAELARQQPMGRFAAVLRSCESRALVEINQREAVNLENWLLIGIDCLASFPEEDFEWRVEKAGSVDELTRENLSHARQGVIAPHRYRAACQMCLQPEAQDSDVVICLLGLPVKDAFLVRTRDESVAERLRMDQNTNGPADPALLAQHEEMLERLSERRERAVERMIHKLSQDAPGNLDELLALLASCEPCRACLEACPIYSLEAANSPDGKTITREGAIRWMVSCVSCGMCEQSCPQDMPLPAIIRRIRQDIRSEMALV